LKRIGITQRVEYVQSYSERRDCLDQRWSAFVFELGCIPIPLPNVLTEIVPTLLDELILDGIILSGGNSINSLNPNADDTAPERDAFEYALLDAALDRNLPVIGVCRGMEMINVYFGGKLSLIRGHVAVRHSISSIEAGYNFPETVNSYHNWGISLDDLANELKPIAVENDNYVEAFKHTEKSLTGIMWHPEREEPFYFLDIELFKSIL
jgi:N5-(cytidine 5'-diphosphoramidyl)-L-glutamine hydrolase